MAAEELALAGECLCGAVGYRVAGAVDFFGHCHCSRCRKATGAGHATNLVLEGSGLRFTRGEELVRRYDLPSARSFATTFCARCGSPLPHRTRSGAHVVVPAGSLEGELDLEPSARIHWSSRASWSCAGDGLPCRESLDE